MGRVRLVVQRGVYECRKGGQIRFRLAVLDSSSPQILARVSYSPFVCIARGCVMAL
jgi:hypothetical protein